MGAALESMESRPTQLSVASLGMAPRACAELGVALIKRLKAPERGGDPRSDEALLRAIIMEHPRVFLGGSNDLPWKDSPLAPFWREFFKARKAGLIQEKAFEVWLGELSKEDLKSGARELLIEAARAGDSESFEKLLGRGAARRSKLVMFAAYQDGGVEVARKVKEPTPNEAKELVGLGAARGAWWRSKAVCHDWEGLQWLLKAQDQDGLTKSLAPEEITGMIICGSEEPTFLSLMRARPGRIMSIEDAPEARLYAKNQNYVISSEEMRASLAMNFALNGMPQAALELARQGPTEAITGLTKGKPWSGALSVAARAQTQRGAMSEDAVVERHAGWTLLTAALLSLDEAAAREIQKATQESWPDLESFKKQALQAIGTGWRDESFKHRAEKAGALLERLTFDAIATEKKVDPSAKKATAGRRI